METCIDCGLKHPSKPPPDIHTPGPRSTSIFINPWVSGSTNGWPIIQSCRTCCWCTYRTQVTDIRKFSDVRAFIGPPPEDEADMIAAGGDPYDLPEYA